MCCGVVRLGGVVEWEATNWWVQVFFSGNENVLKLGCAKGSQL